MKSCVVIGFGNIGPRPYRIRLWFAMIKALLRYMRPFTWPKVTHDVAQGIPIWKITSHVFLKSSAAKSSSISVNHVGALP
jgi:hypothetical protein